MPSAIESTALPFPASHIEDLSLASSMLSGEERRAFQAAMALKYCEGNARQTERVFGWGRETVQLGLHEHRTGILCVGAQAAFGGKRLWEEQHPEVAQALWALADSHSQQDPTFRTTLQYPRLTAAAALAPLRAHGFPEERLPAPSTMAEVLNRNGYRLRQVIKVKPQKTPGNRRHLCQPRRQGWQARGGDGGCPRGAGQTPEYRLQSHGEAWRLRTRWEKPG